jgi:hypothetical protein
MNAGAFAPAFRRWLTRLSLGPGPGLPCSQVQDRRRGTSSPPTSRDRRLVPRAPHHRPIVLADEKPGLRHRVEPVEDRQRPDEACNRHRPNGMWCHATGPRPQRPGASGARDLFEPGQIELLPPFNSNTKDAPTGRKITIRRGPWPGPPGSSHVSVAGSSMKSKSSPGPLSTRRGLAQFDRIWHGYTLGKKCSSIRA